MAKERSTIELQKTLEDRRDTLLREVKQVEQALSGLALANMLADKNGAAAGVSTLPSRSGEHVAPAHVEEAVRRYIATTPGRISMKAMRAQLANNKEISKDELGFGVAVVMRKLTDEKVVDVVVRGIGRRDAVYEKSKH